MLHTHTITTVAPTYDEIIFQHRNRAYGAFDLRQHYQPTLFYALWIGVGWFYPVFLRQRFTPASSRPIYFRLTRLWFR